MDKYVKWAVAILAAGAILYGVVWFIGYISYQLTHMM